LLEKGTSYLSINVLLTTISFAGSQRYLLNLEVERFGMLFLFYTFVYMRVCAGNLFFLYW
jgi:hypothetical protein